MERLTQKREDGFYELKESQELYGKEDVSRLVQVIGKYEDTEENLWWEFGCDKTAVFKALTEGCWIMTGYKKVEHVLPSEIRLGIKYAGTINQVWSYMCLYIELNGKPYSIKTGDHGIKWALTKEELE